MHNGGGAGRDHELARSAPFAVLEEALHRLAGRSPVLDLGCGTGFWLRRMGAAGLRPVGVEQDRARAGVAAGSGPVVVADGARLPFADAVFGSVWCLHVLHHLARPEAVLAEVRRVLRPGAHLFLAESVEDNPGMRAVRRLWPRWEGVPVLSRFRSRELAAMVSASGLELVDHRHHSPFSAAALALPWGRYRLWAGVRRLERRLPRWLGRWGAHVDVVARAP
ncbi:MAG: class I SAM-dependent methyltransferase [Actinomycetota bacterium]|nr:class I SAM-dependent methyltransferase [Actinomycetota bacterium]